MFIGVDRTVYCMKKLPLFKLNCPATFTENAFLFTTTGPSNGSELTSECPGSGPPSHNELTPLPLLSSAKQKQTINTNLDKVSSISVEVFSKVPCLNVLSWYVFENGY